VLSNRKISGAVSFLQITLETGFVEVTEDHLIKVDDKWMPCRHLNVSMEFGTQKILKI
jgi:hypothetical protein